MYDDARAIDDAMSPPAFLGSNSDADHQHRMPGGFDIIPCIFPDVMCHSNASAIDGYQNSATVDRVPLF